MNLHDFAPGGKYSGKSRPEDLASPEEFRQAMAEAVKVYDAWVADPGARKEFFRQMEKLDEQYRPLIESLERSERLNAEDYNVHINT